MITKNLSTLKIHKLTQAQYNRELANGTIDETALYLTPDEEVDMSLYATVEQLNTTTEYLENKLADITPSNLDYAVKKGLADSKLEWTEEEKASARMQLGAAGLDDIINVEYLNAQLNALITVADIDTICGGNIVAASEVTF